MRDIFLSDFLRVALEFLFAMSFYLFLGPTAPSIFSGEFRRPNAKRICHSFCAASSALVADRTGNLHSARRKAQKAAADQEEAEYRLCKKDARNHCARRRRKAARGSAYDLDKSPHCKWGAECSQSEHCSEEHRNLVGHRAARHCRVSYR